MGRRPTIGLLGDRRTASFGAWSDVELCFVWHHYVDAVTAAGGAAVTFPPEPWLGSDPGSMLDLVDGLLLTGGRDIDARVYGAEPHERNERGDAGRDRVELELARAALARAVPVLGVCRGMQVLNIARGGGIDQHLDDLGAVHRAEPGAFVPHDVIAEAGSTVASILGPDPVEVRSHHHQGLGTLGAGLAVSARSPDGLIEAIEGVVPGDFCVAVLWHPEEDLEGGGLALYRALVEAASAGGSGARGGEVEVGSSS